MFHPSPGFLSTSALTFAVSEILFIAVSACSFSGGFPLGLGEF